MKAVQTHEEMIAVINSLNRLQQIKLLDFVRSFFPVKSKKKNNLLKFAGSISKSDLYKMEKAIEEECEKVNNNEW